MGPEIESERLRMKEGERTSLLLRCTIRTADSISIERPVDRY